jgi:hypothetical protein
MILSDPDFAGGLIAGSLHAEQQKKEYDNGYRSNRRKVL